MIALAKADRACAVIVPALLVAFPVLAVCASHARAVEPLQYNRDIRPILAENCFACHGADSAARKADLRLDQRNAAIEMGAITVGAPDESELIARIFADDADFVMPPLESKKKLTDTQKETLKKWIAAGAEYQQHWSFVVPQRPRLPAVKQESWPKNAIDRFVLARLETRGLSPAPAADTHTLFRRLHLDITGLPPAPKDVEEFVNDYRLRNDDTLSDWIDKLMDSPAWGEHRARYWLDAARYGDTHGLQHDNYREMWPYRDWVIRAFMSNQPFDTFTVEQIAGDLLANPTNEQLIATGFQRCNITTNEGGSIEEENLVNYAADRVQTLGWVYLGLTTNCSQCHDHKFDDFTMKDYYSLAAYFRNTTQPALDGNAKDGLGPVLVVPAESDEPRWQALPAEIAAADAKRNERKKYATGVFNHWLTNTTAESLGGETSTGAVQDARIYSRALGAAEVKKIAEISEIRAVLATAADKRTPQQQATLYDYYLITADPQYPALAKAVADLEVEREAIRARSPITHIQQEKMDSIPTGFVLMRGEYDKPGEKVAAATPAGLHPMPEGAPNNRLGLARWIVDPANPLTARVTANRFWQEIFGQGLVTTPEDFGVVGAEPSHPELLDWLAVEFRSGGWDVKKFFKLMLMSATYRQAAVTTLAKLEKDRNNALLSRGPRFRMDAEMVRDYALAASGLLSSRMYGPGAKPYQPEDIWDIVGMPNSDTRHYVQDKGDNLYRRTVYSFWKRMAPPPNLDAFNAPSREVCTVRRERTNTPLQALVTLNDPQFVESARRLAETALKAGDGDDVKTINVLFGRVLCRPLNEEEQPIVHKDLQEFLAHYRSNPKDAQPLIAVGESKVDETLDASELAAWTMLANQVLNLDEALNK